MHFKYTESFASLFSQLLELGEGKGILMLRSHVMLGSKDPKIQFATVAGICRSLAHQKSPSTLQEEAVISLRWQFLRDLDM